MIHRHLVKKVEIRFISGDIRVILMMTLDDSGDITQMVLYNVIILSSVVRGLVSILKVYGSSPESDTLGMAEDFIVNKWWCKVRT
jgi:hypothetical protein